MDTVTRKWFLMSTIMFVLAMTTVFVVYDAILASRPCDGCDDSGVDPATIFWQVFAVSAGLGVFLLILVKWNANKRMKENSDPFRKMIRSNKH